MAVCNASTMLPIHMSYVSSQLEALTVLWDRWDICMYMIHVRLRWVTTNLNVTESLSTTRFVVSIKHRTGITGIGSNRGLPLPDLFIQPLARYSTVSIGPRRQARRRGQSGYTLASDQPSTSAPVSCFKAQTHDTFLPALLVSRASDSYGHPERLIFSIHTMLWQANCM